MASYNGGAIDHDGGAMLLAPLVNYGGPTQTMPPLHDSRPRLIQGWIRSPTFSRPTSVVTRACPGRTWISARWKSSGRFSTVLASTNITLPLGQWSILGPALQVVPGQYQFVDPSATNYPQRFYRVTSP